MERTPRFFAASVALATLLASSAAQSATLQVGPDKTYAKPCAAIAAAQNGDTIEIDAGTYANDVCVVQKSGLTLRGVGGRAKLDATGFTIPNGKAIWVIAGNDTTVENIEFTGASVVDQNGAGIRQEGANLTVRGCYFHDNDDGILAGDNMASEILVETSEFANNGFGDGYSHNMYVNHVKKFTLRFSYSHGTPEGHLVKSRALESHILYNRITDEPGTTASYEINLPNGGKAFVIGNLIEQGQDTHNPSIVSFGEEGPAPGSALYFVNNTVVNNRAAGGTFVRVAAAVTTPAVLRNNIFSGKGTICDQASAVLDHNFTMGDPMLANAEGFDFHLLAGSPCADMGADPGMGEGQSLAPVYQYVHPASYEMRTSVGTIDIGAYELGGGGGMGGGGTGGGSASSSSGMASSSSGMASSSSGGAGGDGNGGSGGNGGAGGGGGGAETGEKGGCGCRAAGENAGGSQILIGCVVLGGLLMKRRSRQRRRTFAAR